MIHLKSLSQMEMPMHLTPQDLADREGVPVATVYAWNMKGTGPPYMHVGRHVRYRLTDVEAWETSLITRSPVA
jgi:predicted DNA-binding transcriptional regulator AlpA